MQSVMDTAGALEKGTPIDDDDVTYTQTHILTHY